METTIRFDNAFIKLYNAFHGGKLDALKCDACAVGNICDNGVSWAHSLGHGVNMNNNIMKNIYNRHPYVTSPYSKNGYNQDELHTIEKKFLSAMIGTSTRQKKDQQKGLKAVIEYIATLDGIDPNDYLKYFEIDADGNAVHELPYGVCEAK